MGVCIFGMGDCNSETSVDISNITNNNTRIDNILRTQINERCNVSLDSSNTINIIGSNVSNLTAKQKNNVQSLCVMQSILENKIDSETTDKLLNSIKNNLETKGALLGAPASNNTVLRSITDNSAAINNEKFNEISKDCILQLKQQNILNMIGSTVKDSNFDQVNDGFMKCMSMHADTTQITNSSLKDTVNNSDTTVKTAGGDPIKSVGDGVSAAAKGVGEGVSTAAQGIGSGFGMMFIIPIVVSVIVLAIIAYMFLQNPESSTKIIEAIKSN